MQDFSAGSMPWDAPSTLGHDDAGWVHRLGAVFVGWAVGQVVAVCWLWGCARCARCPGEDAHCPDQVEVVIDFVGSDETLVLAARIVRNHGDVTIVGTGGGALPFSCAGSRSCSTPRGPIEARSAGVPGCRRTHRTAPSHPHRYASDATVTIAEAMAQTSDPWPEAVTVPTQGPLAESLDRAGAVWRDAVPRAKG